METEETLMTFSRTAFSCMPPAVKVLILPLLVSPEFAVMCSAQIKYFRDVLDNASTNAEKEAARIRIDMWHQLRKDATLATSMEINHGF